MPGHVRRVCLALPAARNAAAFWTVSTASTAIAAVPASAAANATLAEPAPAAIAIAA